ncbi:DUF1127 domain-containing protein [Litorisediminicola beolgyonensis]|uniref:DUF1127 domain-containing protein n=1 Tax=Litorisediminicola beolgyonensis TaxID=1173614 RepID=A0ABW3ZKS4_9RHOB
MAYATHISSAPTGRFETFTASLRTALQRRRVFSRTLKELSALSDRELADLGLHRSMLRRIAQEAAQNVA